VAGSVVEPMYRAVVSTRNRMFDRELLHVRRLPRPVVSIGNLTTGGTGKTPVVQWLARRLRDAGRPPAVLLRGYRRGENERSDEEAMLADSLPGVPVMADANRYRGGLRVLRSGPQVHTLILDDGFQHRRLHRDVDIVLIDASNPFGYDHVLPRGLLREPPASLRRAHAVVLTRVDQTTPDVLQDIRRQVAGLVPEMAVFDSRHAFDAVRFPDVSHPPGWLAGRRVLAFCGIGNPSSFRSLLARAGADVVQFRSFIDHHAYDDSDIDQLVEEARRQKADALLTTAKDWVKLNALPGFDPHRPIGAVEMVVRFPSGEDEERLLQVVLARTSGPRVD
jgi:tetraacyldisaccharide 4'-kinase